VVWEACGAFLVVRKFRQRLGDISMEDVGKEGYSSLQEFKRAGRKFMGAIAGTLF
jgi:hypothetical protein